MCLFSVVFLTIKLLAVEGPGTGSSVRGTVVATLSVAGPNTGSVSGCLPAVATAPVNIINRNS